MKFGTETLAVSGARQEKIVEQELLEIIGSFAQLSKNWGASLSKIEFVIIRFHIAWVASRMRHNQSCTFLNSIKRNLVNSIIFGH